MNDGTIEETFPDAPNAESLFLPGTPSAAGTPARSRASRAPDTSPSRNAVSRRAMGMNTPQNFSSGESRGGGVRYAEARCVRSAGGCTVR